MTRAMTPPGDAYVFACFDRARAEVEHARLVERWKDVAEVELALDLERRINDLAERIEAHRREAEAALRRCRESERL